MKHYIDKDALVAEIKRLKERAYELYGYSQFDTAYNNMLKSIDSLEVKDSYEECIQYNSIKAGIQAHAETYSFNIESELFNQLTLEQQKLWRKEIEQACISGGEIGIELARDTRYKENLEAKGIDIEQLNKLLNWWKEVTTKHSTYKVKEVDLDEEFDKYTADNFWTLEGNNESPYLVEKDDMLKVAKNFFELGISVGNKSQKEK